MSASRTPFIAGNWKMHKTIAETEEFIAGFLPRVYAADGDDDFDLVARGEQGFGMAALRHDLAVALDRDALAGEAARFEQGGDGKGCRQLLLFAVDDEVHGLT